jgi:hypothetical protein
MNKSIIIGVVVVIIIVIYLITKHTKEGFGGGGGGFHGGGGGGFHGGGRGFGGGFRRPGGWGGGRGWGGGGYYYRYPRRGRRYWPWLWNYDYLVPYYIDTSDYITVSDIDDWVLIGDVSDRKGNVLDLYQKVDSPTYKITGNGVDVSFKIKEFLKNEQAISIPTLKNKYVVHLS